MTEMMMAIESIRIDGRHRKDLGDLGPLAESIKREGLLNPITITPGGRLLAGERRLAAVRLLGRTKIEARIVDTLDDAAVELRIERDENVERKDMTPSELVALGRALEELERPRAAEREAKSRHRAGRARHGLPPAEGSTEPSAESGKTREIVAGALGMSTSSYGRAKGVVEAAEDESLPEAVREAAKEAVEDMDSGAASITAAYERVTSEKKIRLGRSSSALEGARLQRAGMKRSLPGLLGTAGAFDLIVEVDPAITNEEVRQWVADLSRARLSIERLIKRLKERISEEP